MLLALVESRTKEDMIFDKISSIIKEDLIKKIINKIYIQLDDLSANTKDSVKVELHIEDLNHVNLINLIEQIDGKNT